MKILKEKSAAVRKWANQIANVKTEYRFASGCLSSELEKPLSFDTIREAVVKMLVIYLVAIIINTKDGLLNFISRLSHALLSEGSPRRHRTVKRQLTLAQPARSQ